MNASHGLQLQVLTRAYKAAADAGAAGQSGFVGRGAEFASLLGHLAFFNNLWHQFEQFDSTRNHRLGPAE